MLTCHLFCTNGTIVSTIPYNVRLYACEPVSVSFIVFSEPQVTPASPFHLLLFQTTVDIRKTDYKTKSQERSD